MSDVFPSQRLEERKRAAVYIRVSTEEQAEKYGLVYQKDEIVAWAKYNPHPHSPYLIHENHVFVDEGYSGIGDLKDRPALNALFEAAKRGEVDTVLVWKIDRFSRRLEYLLRYVRELDEIGVSVISITQPQITGPTGKLLLSVLGAIGEIERDNIIERTSAGKLAAARSGKWVGGKYPPYGYDIDEERKISVNEEEAKIVKQMFTWFVHDKLSIFQIQQRMLSLKIPTKADTFMEQRKKEGKKVPALRSRNPSCFWNTTTIVRALSLSAYMGMYFYGKRGKKKDPKTGKTHEFLHEQEALVRLPCPAIVDSVTYEQSLQRLAENKRLAKRNSKHIYLFTGKIFCGVCESTFCGYAQKKFRKRKCIAEYLQYRCKRTNRSVAPVPCTNARISEMKLESRVWEQLYAFLSDPRRFIQELQERENRKSDVQKTKQELAIIEKGLDANTKERERIMYLYEKGLGYQEAGALDSRLVALSEEEKRFLIQQKSISGRMLTKVQERERLQLAAVLARRYRKYLNGATAQTKRDVIQALVKKITVYPDRISVELRIEKPKPYLIQRGALTEDRTLQLRCGGVGW